MAFLLDADPPEEGNDLQEDLFDRVVARSGHLTDRTVYSFAPRVQDGGTIRAEYATVADAADELRLLRTLRSPEITRIG